jgi:hypothetical protein
MSRSYLALAALLVGAAVLLAAGADPPPPAEKAPADGTQKGPFDAALLKVAATYTDFGRVDDEMRWAPFLCRMPRPARAYASASKEADTHGQKLYSLFVKNPTDYPLSSEPVKNPEAAKTWRAKVGQAIVKQSWVPEELKEAPAKLELRVRLDPKDAKTLFRDDHFVPYARKGDKLFKASKQADLFIMLKRDPTTAETDDGWVYGTVTPDGKKVTSAGKVESCMGCHQQAVRDRLFGLTPPSWNDPDIQWDRLKQVDEK